jgi:hypothetical protein
MMPHPDMLFRAAQEKLERYEREITLTRVLSRLWRHRFASLMRDVANRLEPELHTQDSKARQASI